MILVDRHYIFPSAKHEAPSNPTSGNVVIRPLRWMDALINGVGAGDIGEIGLRNRTTRSPYGGNGGTMNGPASITELRARAATVCRQQQKCGFRLQTRARFR